MKTENEQVLLDVESENVYYFSGASTFDPGINYLRINTPVGVSVASGLYIGASAPGSVDIEGAAITVAEPTGQFLTIYPRSEYESFLDILTDLDIPFKPRESRIAKGVIKKRVKAEFTTAFTEELTDITEID